LENLPVEFEKLQSLVELDLFNCSELGCLPYSIVHLPQLKTFQLWGCHKLETLPVEFEKLQSLVELDLSNCSELGCLSDWIVDLSHLKTFWLFSCHKLENLPVEFGKLQSLVELHLSDYSEVGCLARSQTLGECVVCAWKQIQFLNLAERFLNLKNLCYNWNQTVQKSEEPGFNPHPKNLQLSLKCQNWDQSSLKKEELHTTGMTNGMNVWTPSEYPSNGVELIKTLAESAALATFLQGSSWLI
jgi:hypothetical protein